MGVARGQNLVKNPDFELLARMLPCEGNYGIGCAKDWRSPTFGGSDYYHEDAEEKFSTPKNMFGIQTPHSGKAYAEITITRGDIEYIATILADTLIKGQDYLVEFYSSRAEKSKSSVKEFGVLFTNKINWSINTDGITEKPSLDFTNPEGYKNTKDWVKLSAVYHANGFETTLILGYFNYDSPQGYEGCCYYYIDDVSVTPIKKKNDSIVKKENKDSIHISKIDTPDTFSPKLGETITLKNIFFTTNKSELLPESFSELDKLVQYLNETPNTSIKISGHTDKTGNEDQNKTLSEARAKAVADYLALKKIDKSRIHYIGYGSSKPIAINDTNEGKQQNRRVEFIINKN
jgi:outer membrane protein OmpA-like peptidoglycan-associated protein